MSEFWKTEFGVDVKNVLVKPGEGGNHEIWMDADRFPAAQKQIFSVVYRNLKAWQHYKRIIKQTNQRWLRGVAALAQQVGKKISRDTLANIHQRFIELHQDHFNKAIWVVFATEPLVAEATEAALANVLKRAPQSRRPAAGRARKTDEYNQWFEVIFSPEEKNAITRAHEAVLALAFRRARGELSGRALVTAVGQLVADFGWIPCYDVIDEPWGADHFGTELEELGALPADRILQDLQNLQESFLSHRKNFQKFLRTVRMTQRERELFIMAHDVVFIKDERDDYRRHGCFLARPIFSEIGRRLGLTLKESAYLSLAETPMILRAGTGPSPSEIRERVGGYLLMRKFGEPLVVASGRRVQTILRQELGKTLTQTVDSVKGIVGSAGFVKGTVAIVRTKHDLQRVHDGDIMVAITTNPDYVPAMRRCSAIVTDEGGITSHAAIVSREFKIPCLVGTKFSTKVFKDGDQIEVDCRKGIARKITR